MVTTNDPYAHTCYICGRHESELQPFLEPPFGIDELDDYPPVGPDDKLALNFRSDNDCFSESVECRDCFELSNDDALRLQYGIWSANAQIQTLINFFHRSGI